MRMFRLIVIAAAILWVTPVPAQELSPRAYWPAPRGTKLLVLGYGYQSGDFITDPTLPIEDADSRVSSAVVAYQQTISVFGRTSNIQVALPFASGSTRADVDGIPARRDVSGVGDIAATWSLALLGAPSLGPKEFQNFRENPRPVVGASVKIIAPTGQYDDDRVINIGNNRWATRLRIGYLQPFAKRWVFELSAGTWFFQDNEDFVGGNRKQRPITFIDANLIRRIRPGFWASLDGTYYVGGRSTVDDTLRTDFQRNGRIGFSLAFPFMQRHVLKFSVNNEVTTEFGGDYNSLGLSYIYRL